MNEIRWRRPSKYEASCCIARRDDLGRFPVGWCSPDCLRRPSNLTHEAVHAAQHRTLDEHMDIYHRSPAWGIHRWRARHEVVAVLSVHLQDLHRDSGVALPERNVVAWLVIAHDQLHEHDRRQESVP